MIIGKLNKKAPKEIKAIHKAFAKNAPCYLVIDLKGEQITIPCFVSQWRIPHEPPYSIDASIVSAAEPVITKKAKKEMNNTLTLRIER